MYSDANIQWNKTVELSRMLKYTRLQNPRERRIIVPRGEKKKKKSQKADKNRMMGGGGRIMRKRIEVSEC